MHFFSRIPFRRIHSDEPVPGQVRRPAPVKEPPDGGWGWVVVLSAFIFNVLVLGFHNSFGVYLISLLETYEEADSTIAWVGSISYGLIMMFGPLSGKLTVKYGAREVSIIGSIIIIISIVCSSFTPSLGVLFFTHGFLTGLGSSFAFTPGMIMVSQYFTTKRSFATGIVMSGGAAGALIQTRLHQFLIAALGWRESLRVFAAVMVLCIIAGFAYIPLNPRGHSRSVADNLKTSPLRKYVVDLGLWKDRVFVIWVLANGFAKFGFFIPFVHLLKHATQLSISASKAGNIMLVLGLSSMISRIVFGKICDSERINRLYINQGSVFLVGLLYLFFPLFYSYGSLIAFGLLLGFADAGNYILLPVLTFDLMGAERMPVAWGFMLTVNSISSFGPPFAGWMNDLTGTYNLGFVVAGVLDVVATFILAMIPFVKRSAVQSHKSIMNVTICESTREIRQWDDINNFAENQRAAQYVKYVSKTTFQNSELDEGTSDKEFEEEPVILSLPPEETI
ncbi:monocarboxylate transporter 10-like isoform X1 [Lepisosteus oculatus]|uniref:monocarboxylate transporter 10-like isoform X1 n=1 Tax=Lepisosteus oculatus TaxID=7918 RepID=UPI0035F51A2F